MSSTSETGHAKNLARFGNLIDITEEMPSGLYSPLRENIFIKNMRGQEKEAAAVLTALKNEEATFNKLKNERADAFELLGPLLPRITSGIVLADATARTREDAQGFVAKIRGERRTEKHSKVPADTATDAIQDIEEEDDYSISVSQQSFDMKLDHYEKLIILVSGLENYGSNDPHLTKEGLASHLQHLSDLNKQARKAGRSLIEARHQRDISLYSDQTGILSVVKLVKAYLRTLDGGVQNIYYKAATKIQFRDLG